MLTKTILESLLIIAGESLLLSASFAQTMRIIRTRKTAGLSAITLALYAAGNIAWMTYFTTLHLWVPFVTNLANLLVTTTALAYVLSNRTQFIRGLTAIAVLGPLTGVLLVVFPHESGWIGFAYNVIAGTPALLRVVRFRKVDGLSEHAIRLGVLSMALILVYAILVHATSLIVSCVWALCVEAVVMRYYYRYRQTE